MASARVVLLLLILNLGIALGAGLYESFVVLPTWLVVDQVGALHLDEGGAATYNRGQRFWIFFSTIPLTILAVTNLWMGWRRCAGTLQNWWVTSAGLALAERVMTFLYFIPIMAGLLELGSAPEAVGEAQNWMNMNYIRLGLLLCAWLAALRTFGLAQHVRKRVPAYLEVRATDAHEEAAR